MTENGKEKLKRISTHTTQLMNTSRLTPKIGQCRPIISCQTVLDWNKQNTRLWKRRTIDRKREDMNKHPWRLVCDKREQENEPSDTAPSYSSERCLQACKPEKSESARIAKLGATEMEVLPSSTVICLIVRRTQLYRIACLFSRFWIGRGSLRLRTRAQN